MLINHPIKFARHDAFKIMTQKYPQMLVVEVKHTKLKFGSIAINDGFSSVFQPFYNQLSKKLQKVFMKTIIQMLEKVDELVWIESLITLDMDTEFALSNLVKQSKHMLIENQHFHDCIQFVIGAIKKKGSNSKYIEMIRKWKKENTFEEKIKNYIVDSSPIKQK
eukprot:NODE_93_length_21530_cov_0.700387.p15 type:complete len:164 gc:universal NODE_93_length_21530_cov_0.700387:12728-13219(+)